MLAVFKERKVGEGGEAQRLEGMGFGIKTRVEVKYLFASLSSYFEVRVVL